MAAQAVMVFDVGGTDIKVALAEANGHVAGDDCTCPPVLREVRRISTTIDSSDPGGSIVATVVAEVSAQREREQETELTGVGVVVPGLVDEVRGTGLLSVNLGWRDYPFKDRLEAALGVPVFFGHDVGTAAEAEHAFGAANGADNALIMVVGTGIAATYFTDGMRLRGNGLAGEVGFSQVPHPDGGLAILEELGSASGITKRYCAAAGIEPQPGFGAREVLQAAAAGDAVAERVFAEGVDALAFVISQSVAMVGTSLVVIGGGLSEAKHLLFTPLAKRVDEILSFQDRPRIIPATLGEDAGVIGCAAKTLHALESRLAA